MKTLVCAAVLAATAILAAAPQAEARWVWHDGHWRWVTEQRHRDRDWDRNPWWRWEQHSYYHDYR